MAKSMEEAVARLAADPVDWRFKGIPPLAEPPSLGAIRQQGWNVLNRDFHFPLMILRESALEHNLGAMARYCMKNNVMLAPHGKTTMAPQLFWRQMQAGAWGITVASPGQLKVAREFDVPRILFANQLIDPSVIRWILAEQSRDPDFEFLCLVDSLDGIILMEEAIRTADAPSSINVLIEMGQFGGRTGCRNLDEGVELADKIRDSQHLILRGVEGFEGLIRAGTPEGIVQAVRDFLSQVRALVVTLDRTGAFNHLDTITVTAGGSAYFDLVIEELANLPTQRPTNTILRSGCYITHDSEMYAEVSPLDARAEGAGDRLQPAFELWATVQSRPEPDLLIAQFGKRDAPYDYRLPTILDARSGPNLRLLPKRQDRLVTEMNDQHAYIRVAEDDPLRVGDILVFGISHPCTAFDKWQLIPVVDDEYNVVDGVRTFF